MKSRMKINLKLNSVKMKMMYSLIPTTLLAFILLAGGAMYFSQNAIMNTGKSLLKETSRIASEEVDNILKEKLKGVTTLANAPDIKNIDTPLETKINIMKQNMEVQEHNNIGIAYATDGIIHYVNGSTVDIKDRDFYIQAMKGNSYISQPFISRIDGKLIVALASPIKSGNDVIGVVVALRNGDDLSNITNGIKLLQNGEAFIIDKSGTYIANKQQEKVDQAYNVVTAAKTEDDKLLVPAFNKMIEGGNDVVEVNSSKNKYFIGYAPVGDLGWSIGITIDRNELLSELNTMKLSAVIMTIIAILVIMSLIVKVALQSSKPVVAVKDIMEEVEKGDFTKTIDSKYLEDKTEIGSMCFALMNTIESIVGILSNIKDNSNKIDTQASGLAAISEEMTALTANIVVAIEEVAKGTTSQAGDLTEISSDLTEFGNEITEISEDVKVIDNLFNEIGQQSQSSNIELKDLSEVIIGLNNNFSSFSQSLEKMTSDIKQVNEMTDLINSISEQTNLLALNAAIEAARAGEFGKGFAVVADEIRKLAEMSKDSSNNIYNIVNNILQNTGVIVEKTNLMSQDIEKQNRVVDKTIQSFSLISEGVELVAPKIVGVSNTFKSIDIKKNNILNRVENISAISEEISATAEEISASSQELNLASEDIANSAENLSFSTGEMDKNLEVFKIK